MTEASSQLRLILVHSVPVDDEIQALRRLHVDAIAQSTDFILSDRFVADASICIVIHSSVSPARLEEIHTQLKARNIQSPLLVANEQQPLSSAIEIARSARGALSGGDQQADAITKRPISLGTKTILVVDDDAILRRALKRTVRRLPASVLEADDPEDAEQFLAEFDIDLIMSDYSFAGGKNGLDFLSDCRKQHPGIPRMLLSGHDIETTIDLPGDRSAADAILQKPWNHDEFLDTCRSLIDGKSADQ